MTSNIKLSICIPTYNRADCLKEALDSLIHQSTNEVEIVISDNASKDNTEEIVNSYRSYFPNLTYYRAEKNQGAGANFLKVIELASGEFCWFLGSDDKIEENGIRTVLSKLKIHPEVSGCCVNINYYDKSLSKIITSKPFFKFTEDTYITDKEVMAEKLFHNLAYLSCVICKKNLWNAVVKETKAEKMLLPYQEIYVHLFVLSTMFLQIPRWLYISQACTGKRNDNDSFLNDLGHFERFKVEVLGWYGIVSQLFNKQDPLRRQILNKVISDFVFYIVLDLKINTDIPSQTIFKTCYPLYRSSLAFWTLLTPLAFIPSFALKMLRSFYRKAVKPFRNKSTIPT